MALYLLCCICQTQLCKMGLRAPLAIMNFAALVVAAHKAQLRHTPMDADRLQRSTMARGHMHRALVKSVLHKNSSVPIVPMYSYDLAEYLGVVRHNSDRCIHRQDAGLLVSPHKTLA